MKIFAYFSYISLIIHDIVADPRTYTRSHACILIHNESLVSVGNLPVIWIIFLNPHIEVNESQYTINQHLSYSSRYEYWIKKQDQTLIVYHVSSGDSKH